MVQAGRSDESESVAGRDEGSAGGGDDYGEYIADMILELQRMATVSGRRGLAEVLGVAYEKAREDRKAT